VPAKIPEEKNKGIFRELKTTAAGAKQAKNA